MLLTQQAKYAPLATTMKKVGFLLLVCFGGSLLTSCSSIFFFPEKEIRDTPASKGYHFTSLHHEMSDGTQINDWIISATTATRKGAILYFHGNSFNMGYHHSQVSWLADQGYDLFMMDYRGFGNSTGTANLKNSLSDIKATTEKFLKYYDGDSPKYFIAQSLGASMAGYVIATEPQLKEQFNGIVLDSAFTSYSKIARQVVGGGKTWTWLWDFPAVLLSPHRFDLIDVIDQISPTPLLLVHGNIDRLVPFSHGEDLYNKALEPKQLISYPSSHLRAFFEDQAKVDIANFIDSNQFSTQTSMASKSTLLIDIQPPLQLKPAPKSF